MKFLGLPSFSPDTTFVGSLTNSKGELIMKINIDIQEDSRASLIVNLFLRISQVVKNETEQKQFQQELFEHLQLLCEYKDLVCVFSNLPSQKYSNQTEEICGQEWINLFIFTCLDNKVRAHKVNEWLRKLRITVRVKSNEQKSRYTLYQFEQCLGYMLCSSSQGGGSVYA